MKKIIAILLTSVMLFVVPVFASKQNAELPFFEVRLNGTSVESSNRQYPLLVYKGITYVPMTYHDCRYLGITTDWDSETSTLTVQKGDVSCAYRAQEQNDPNSSQCIVTECDFNIVVNGKRIDNSKEEYPLLLFRQITYFPLTWRFAVEEFGWEYYYDSQSGLSINSGNQYIHTLSLPHFTGNAATDGEYYYYIGDKDGKSVVYRTPVSNISSTKVIHEIPDTPMSWQISRFVEDEGDVYIYYWVGSSPIMSSERYYKIESDGSVTEKNPQNYFYYRHGGLTFRAQKDGITVKFDNDGKPLGFSYIKDGVEILLDPLQENFRIGSNKEGGTNYSVFDNTIQIYNNKIYYTAFNAVEQTPSSLYCINIADGSTHKIMDKVYGFWAFGKETTGEKILYDFEGKIMMYNTLTGESVTVNDNCEEGIVLEQAIGETEVYAVLKSLSGNRTVVKKYDFSSDLISEEILLDTNTNSGCSVLAGKLCVYLNEEKQNEETRLLVIDEEKGVFRSSDTIKGIFVFEDTLMYGIDEKNVAIVNFK